MPWLTMASERSVTASSFSSSRLDCIPHDHHRPWRCRSINSYSSCLLLTATNKVLCSRCGALLTTLRAFQRDLNLKFEFWMCWSLHIFGCLCVCLSQCRLFVLFVTMVLNFGDDCCFINCFKPAVNDVDDGSSSWKMEVPLWNKKKGLFLWFLAHEWWVCNKNCYKHLFPKLKKHSPTNFYMLYPMVQSVALVCLEINKKLTLQRQCPLSSPKSFWCAASTPQRAKQKPYLQGTGAPRHYPHTLICMWVTWLAWLISLCLRVR